MKVSDDRFVPTQNYQKVKSLCGELLESRLGVEIAAITGRAGRGKSTATERIYVKEYPSIYVEYEGGWSHSALLREISFNLDGTRPRTRQGCDEVIKNEFAANRRIVIVDNADRMPLICFDVLRNIHDKHGVPVLLVGETKLVGKLQRERWLISRVREVFTFEPVGQADIAIYFKKTLGVQLAPEHTVRLLRSSGGDFRPVTIGAATAKKVMKVSGISTITDAVINEACKSMKKDKVLRNEKI